MSMRKGQYDICKVCKYFGIGKTKSKRYGERKVKKCYYNSKYGKSLYNLDICPMEKTLFSCGTDSTEIHGIIKGDLTDEDIEDLKCQVEKFMQYAKEKRNGEVQNNTQSAR